MTTVSLDVSLELGLLAEMPVGAYIVSPDRVIAYWNPMAEEITGYPAEDVVGRHCSENLLVHVDEHGRELCDGNCPVSAALADGKSRVAQVFLHHAAGHRMPVEVKVVPIPGPDGRPKAVVEFFTDLSKLIFAQHRLGRLETLSLTDEASGMPNRRFLECAIDRRLGDFTRNNRSFGILVVRLDSRVLPEGINREEARQSLEFMAGKTVSMCCRAVDEVGVWSGLGFVAVSTVDTAESLQAFGDRIGNLVAESFIFHDGQRICSTVSIGGVFPTEQISRQELIEKASRLCEEAGQAGGNRCIIG